MGSMIEARKRCHNAYQTEHYKTVSVTVNRDKDADVLARLTEQKNVSGYVRELVKRDIALKEAIERVPTVDIDAITESHEMIGYDRGFRDGYAQATSEVRHGHWIEGTKVHPDLMNDSTYNYECSECGYWDQHGANVEVPYCWHCGCKMDEVAE